MLFAKIRPQAGSDVRIFLLLAASAASLAAVGAAGCFFAACAFDERTEVAWGGELSLPEYTGASMVSESQVAFSFSQPVAAADVFVASAEEGGFEAEAFGGEGEYSSEVLVNLSSPPSTGEKFVLAMTVATAQGNTLSLS